ncbi:MAG: hypothetical protein FGM52_10840, partial [Mycobacterium sp.]|nr:hypothetical protein [Mycobacterium sp.]
MTPVLLAGVVAAGPERPAVTPVAATPVSAPVPSVAAAPRPVFDTADARALRIPAKALSAYRKAERAMGALAPDCGVSWNLLAGVGRLAAAPAGEGAATVRAVSSRTDKLPSATWSRFASDGDGDGRLDPTNLFDATLATARHLCSSGLNFRDHSQALVGLLRYNNSMAYAANVLGWAAAYATGTAPLNLPPIYGPVPVLGPYLPGRLWGLSQGGTITQAGYLLP